MHQLRSKTILFYFFFIIILGSINNFELKKNKSYEVKNIEITGLGKKENMKLLKQVKNLNLENIFLLNSLELSQIFSTNSLVENYEIIKIYPSSILIKITKTKFLAIINKNGKIFYIGSNGKLSKYDNSKTDLPFIFGNPDNTDFLNFKKKIDESKFSYNQIKNLYFFPSRRWDLKLQNNILIKLPKEKIKSSLDYSFDFIKNNKIEDSAIIDLRVKKQIILND